MDGPASQVALVVKNLPDYARGALETWSDPWVGRIPWRRPKQPTAVFLPGESHQQRSLAGSTVHAATESDTTEVTYHAHMDGLRDSHQSEVSEREKQTLYINAYMWNLKKNWQTRSYVQSRNRDTGLENKRVDTKGEGGGWDELGGWDWRTCTIDTMDKIGN